MKIHHLTQLEEPFFISKPYGNRKYVKCLCDCGEICTVIYSEFICKRRKICSKNCKFSKRIPVKQAISKDNTIFLGQKINNWTVIDIEPKIEYKQKFSKKKNKKINVKYTYIKCRCNCGTERYLNYYNLIRKNTRSCGCYRNEHLIKKYQKNNNGFKKCNKCKNIKPITDFYNRGTYYKGHSSECKFCIRIISFIRSSKFKYNFIDIYNFVINHNWCCDICGDNQEGIDKGLHIDHNHTTGAIRGIICDKCNPGLGQFKDSIELLERAIEYLKKDGYIYAIESKI